jgi:hypothetical protein
MEPTNNSKNYSQIFEEMKSDIRLLNESQRMSTNVGIIRPLFEAAEECNCLKKGISPNSTDEEVLEAIDVLSEKYLSYLLSSEFLAEAEEEENTEPDPPTEEEPLPNEEETEPEETNIEKEIADETDEEKKERLQVLDSIIKQKLIHKFAKTPVDINRITKTLINFITKGHDEAQIKNELDQRAFIDFSLDVMNVLLKNKRIASLVGLEAITEEKEVITEAAKGKNPIKKKRREKNAPKKVDTISPKLDMLLRLGLVDKKLYARAKRALANKKATGSISIYRNILFDLLDDIIQYIQKDPTLYNRMRINVMKEMKNSLPKKEDLIAAYESGQDCRRKGLTEDELPEEFMTDEFLKEAWYKGFNNKEKPQFKKPQEKDSPHYRTDHHYGDGDIDPETVPIFKSSLNKDEDDIDEKKSRFRDILQKIRGRE